MTPPHSLRKLIEWKRDDKNVVIPIHGDDGSSLAEETN